jgi:hypothetical protein
MHRRRAMKWLAERITRIASPRRASCERSMLRPPRARAASLPRSVKDGDRPSATRRVTVAFSQAVWCSTCDSLSSPLERLIIACENTVVTRRCRLSPYSWWSPPCCGFGLHISDVFLSLMISSNSSQHFPRSLPFELGCISISTEGDILDSATRVRGRDSSKRTLAASRVEKFRIL